MDVDLAKLEPGTLIVGPQWSGPATLIAAIPKQGLLIIQHDGETQNIAVPAARHGIRPADHVHGEPWKAFVAVERLRHECATHLGMQGSAHQLPHQIKTIYQVSGEPGRIRYMVADEPGGGKTVVASRIIQELAIQKQAGRVLVVAPAPLTHQWQKELKRFTGLDSVIVERGAGGRTNPWISNDHILITSMDYAKQENQMQMLKQAKFDLVAVDEAHNLNATTNNVTARYKLGRLLGDISHHMLFLTATPHRGKPENFRLLLKLLEPDLFSDRNMSAEDIYNAKDRLFIRHAKGDMVDMDGKKLFKKRSVTSVKYMMSDAERRLYDTVTEYVNRQYSIQAGRDPNKIATFAVLVIQKRMASSTRALLESLKRRRARLGERLDSWDGPADNATMDDIDDLDDEGTEKIENDAAAYSAAQTAGELESELSELDGLISLAEQTSKTKPDTKLDRLMSEISSIGRDRLLIFSEYRDTLDYLEEHIAKMRRADGSPYGICRIDGTMDMADREDAQHEFRSRAQIMLATDAAREGINLQFCHRMVNYDLPWTPISLEQRMGRLHRYGQEHDVVISNMVADGTREGHVMETLFEKIRLIEQQYPTFNVMGQILAGNGLKGLMTDAIRGGSGDSVADAVGNAAEDAKRVDEMLGRTPVDVDDVRRSMERIESQRTDGPYLAGMAERLFKGLGGSVRRVDGRTTLDVPAAIRSGPLPRRRQTYAAPPEELFARGGPVYDHISEWIRANCSDDLTFGSAFRDPGGFDGHVVFHTVRIHDKARRTVGRLLAAHKCTDDGVVRTDPYVLHGMEYDTADAGPGPDMEPVREAVREAAQSEADEMAAERLRVWEHRTGAAKGRMQAEMAEIRRDMNRMGFGSARSDLDDRHAELKRMMAEADTEHETATTLSHEVPVLVGWVRVMPGSEGPPGAQHTERIGMDLSMEHERAEGFSPKDVSGTRGIGYDILSTHPDGQRREIEVKASCDRGNIELTQSEYEHAKRSSHAVIHSISNAGQPDQRLTVVSDPGSLKTTKKTVHEVTRSEIERLAD